MIIQETEIGRTDPLSTEARARAERDHTNIHVASSQMDIENSEGVLSPGLADAKTELKRADAIREKASEKLRLQIQKQTAYQNQLESFRVLKGEIETAELALSEYQFTLKNSTASFETWPFWVKQGGARFGGAMRDFATSISTARELIPLLEPWIETAKKRLASLENSAAAFKEKHKLE